MNNFKINSLANSQAKIKPAKRAGTAGYSRKDEL